MASRYNCPNGAKPPTNDEPHAREDERTPGCAMSALAARADRGQSRQGPGSEEALRNAIACHQAGRLQQAKEWYRAVLQSAPHHPDANHNLGILALQVGQAEEGLAHIRTALQANPSQGQYWQSYLNALVAAKCHDDALDAAQECTARFAQAAWSWKALGVVLMLLGRPAEALAPMQMATRLTPEDVEALNNLGNAFCELGRLDEAETTHRRAIAIAPQLAKAHYNLGIVLMKAGRFGEAEASFRLAVRIRPDFAHAFGSLGGALKALGRPDESEAWYRRALEIEPSFAEAHVNLGNILKDRGMLGEAETCYRRALAIDPSHPETYGNLGAVLIDLGRTEEALEKLQCLLRLRPDHQMAQHLVASLSGRSTESAPAEYVATMFDRYADRFDTHLQTVLGYACPKALLDLLRMHSALEAGAARVLDLGCGTGLVGEVIAPYSGDLVGVDLSAKMLEHAKAKALYQRLECMDVLAMMREEQSCSYDIIAAADVFVYVGRIDDVVCEAKRLLRPGGHCAFTVEAMAETGEGADVGYRLQTSGRFCHSADYVRRLAAANGLDVLRVADTTIRKERGEPIAGYLVLLKAR